MPNLNDQPLDAVTGAFGYTGKYITRRLLALGHRIRTLTGHPERPNPFGDQVAVVPFHFDNRPELAKNLQGVTTLYNTYWIRFNYGQLTYDKAVENTKVLVTAAREAGVGRVVHVSIAKPSADSHLPYYQGKGILENFLKESGLSYAIVRPTVIYGDEDILINNIAWFLRKLHLFGYPGWGQYQMQPIFVEDMADLVVKVGQQTDNLTIDAVGPEIYTFKELAYLIKNKIGCRALIFPVPPRCALWFVRVIGLFVGDVILTPEEIAGLMANLLVTDSPATGPTRLSDWLSQHAGQVGARYASELQRHYRP